MFRSVSRLLLSASLVAVLAGCNSLGFGGDKPAAEQPADVAASSAAPAVVTPAATTLPAGTPANAANATGLPLVQGKCPQISMRDGDAFYRSYAKGAKDDPTKIVYQASIVDFTRQCTLNASTLNVTVVAQGRLIAGPLGGPGKVTLPIRVSVFDGETQLYSEVTNFQTEIAPGASSAQFLFRKDGIALPGGAGALARVNIGFDQPGAAPKKKKK